jgi:Relaxase/Mobilisation nuclease domain
MTTAIAAINSALAEWHARQHATSVRTKSAGKRLHLPKFGSTGSSRQANAPGKAAAARKQLQNTMRKTPQVVVKVTGGGRSIAQLQKHLSYISRNGKLQLKDQDDHTHADKLERSELLESWQKEIGLRYPEQVRDEDNAPRLAYQLVLSMPPGTEERAMNAAAEAFLRETFPHRKYVFVQHYDEPHPHIHVVVQAHGLNGKRLNPRKADLQKWRETFAHEQ